MLRNHFENIITGGNRNEDAHLPKDRRHVFLDIMKNRMWTWMLIGMLTFLFIIPLVVYGYFAEMYVTYVSNVFASDNVDPKLLEFVTSSIACFTSIPFIMLAFLGIGGGFYDMQQLVFAEVFFVGPDFFKGIKYTWKSSLLSGFITGILLTFVTMNFRFYLYASDIPSLISIFFLIVVVIVSLLGLFYSSSMILQDTIYTNNLKARSKNAFIFSLALYPKNLLFHLLGFLLIIPEFLISILIFKLMYLIIVFLFGISMMLIILTLYNDYVFDKYINAKYVPEEVGKGMERKD